MKNKILNSLKQQQEEKAKSLKSYMTRVRDEADRVLGKLEKEGVEGYYSCNSPLHEWVDKAWTTSLAMSELRMIQTRIEDDVRRRKKK